MKTKKIVRIFVALMAVFTVLSISTTMQAHAAGWTSRQEIVHQIADLGRSLGLAEDHPLIVICQDIWWADHDGRDLSSIGSYTSNRTGQTYGWSNSGCNTSSYYYQTGTGNYRIENGNFVISYGGYEWRLSTTDSSTNWYRYANGSYESKVYASSYENSQLWSLYNQYFPNGSSGYYNQNSTSNYRIENGEFVIYYGGYEWRLSTTDSSTNWYRYANGSYGSKVYASSYENSQLWSLYNQYFPNGSSGYYNQNTQTGGNSSYNYNQFSGYNWYNGVIAPPYDQYIESEAKELVFLTYEYVKNMSSQTSQAKIMQVALNIANGGSVSLARNGFAKYNANAPYTDSNNRSLLALARDVIWRNIAVKNGYTSAGIVASSNATHFSITGDSVTLKDDNGNVVNDNLRSPYAS